MIAAAPPENLLGDKPRAWDLPSLAVATVVCLLPFLDKAYCIDDPLFLWAAAQIQQQPLDFYGFSVNWDGVAEPMHAVTKNPPLACFYLALWAAIVGWSEPALHAAFWLPAFGVVSGTWCLARRFCKQPLGAALAVLCSPVFLVSSTNVMCDTLALCCWVWAIALWIKGLDEAKGLWLAAAALLVAASALTKYFGASLIPLLAVYTLVRDRRGAAALCYFLIPLAVLALYQWWTWRLYGRGLLVDAATFAASARTRLAQTFWYQTISVLSFTGGCLLPLACCAPWLVSRRGLLIGCGIAAASATLIASGIPAPVQARAAAHVADWSVALESGALCACAWLGIWLAWDDLRTRRDPAAVLLALWIGGTIAFAGYVNWTCNGRSVLPLVPAAGILLARRIERRTAAGLPAWRWEWGLVPAAALALVVAWADCRLADSARSAAERVAEICQPRENVVWFEGHWGFQYYMQELGAKPVDFAASELRKNDWLVIAFKSLSTTKLPAPHAARLAEGIEAEVFPWCSTWDSRLGAGFYSDYFGPLPFAMGRAAPETYGIWWVQVDAADRGAKGSFWKP